MDEIADFVNRIQTDDNPFKARLIYMLSKMTEAEWVLLGNMVDRMISEQEEEPEEYDYKNMTVEDAEELYKKSRLNAARKRKSSASSTTEGSEAFQPLLPEPKR